MICCCAWTAISSRKCCFIYQEDQIKARNGQSIASQDLQSIWNSKDSSVPFRRLAFWDQLSRTKAFISDRGKDSVRLHWKSQTKGKVQTINDDVKLLIFFIIEETGTAALIKTAILTHLLMGLTWVKKPSAYLITLGSFICSTAAHDRANEVNGNPVWGSLVIRSPFFHSSAWFQVKPRVNDHFKTPTCIILDQNPLGILAGRKTPDWWPALVVKRTRSQG